MSNQVELLGRALEQFAANIPPETVTHLANELGQLGNGDWNAKRNRLLSAVATPVLRHRIETLIMAWQAYAPEMDGAAIALALLTARETMLAQRTTQMIDLVWTGPDSRVIPLRRTDQALLQLINRAEQQLLIVSFAVYQIPSIVQALGQAAQRGVRITICIESPDASEGKIAYDTMRAFGDTLRQTAQFYVWPPDKRLQSSDGKHGSLHAKVAVADHQTLFISSANLTAYAMNLNMEMGILIQGGELPGQVAQHFETLMANKIFAPITVSTTSG